jgi:tetratricopeptide (TPR) repeat protein
MISSLSSVNGAAATAVQTNSNSTLRTVREAIWENYAQLADNAYRKSFFDIATKMLQAAIRDLNNGFPEVNDLPLLLSELGKHYYQNDQYKKAEVVLKRSLESFQREKRNYDPLICPVLQMLGDIYSYHGRYQFAERLFKRQFSVTARLYGKKDTRLIQPLTSLIDLYRKYGKTERANALKDRMRNLDVSLQT